jgi:hypothetical protein
MSQDSQPICIISYVGTNILFRYYYSYKRLNSNLAKIYSIKG